MNKKITLAIFTCLFTAASFAQISKGTTFIGGSAGLNVNSYHYDETHKDNFTSFSVSPSLGFTYKENKVFGFLLNYQHSNNGQLPVINLYGAGVFLRQYKPLGKGFYVFAQEALNFNYTKFRVDSLFRDNNKTIAAYANLNPGLAYDLTKRMQVELLFGDLINVGYTNNKYLNPANNTSNFYINSSFNLSQLGNVGFGVRFLLGRS